VTAGELRFLLVSDGKMVGFTAVLKLSYLIYKSLQSDDGSFIAQHLPRDILVRSRRKIYYFLSLREFNPVCLQCLLRPKLSARMRPF